jgi:pimeloyl-ACP methyl ester carboxylesterase
MNRQSHVAHSIDGTPIQYEVHGTGATALIFVHGWCCDRRYWDQQVDHFAPHYTVVLLDLAGHGASGQERIQWTIPAFGQDVVAVVEHLGLSQVVLIGHSLGGPTIVEAARHLPTAVIGLVGVDTWSNIEQTRTPEQVAAAVAPFRANFAQTARAVARTLFVPTSEPALVERVVAAMTATPSQIGISTAEALASNGRNLREGLQEIKAPMIAINADTFGAPNVEMAERQGIEVVLMSGVGHFVMLEDPQTFNRLLDAAVRRCIQAKMLP